MAEDVRDSGVSRNGPGEQEIDGRARRLEEEFQHGLRILWEGQRIHTLSRTWCCRVNEDNGISLVQQLPDGLKSAITQIRAVMVRLDRDPIRVQTLAVKRRLDLLDCPWDIREWCACKIPDAIGTPLLELRRRLITLACHTTSEGVVTNHQMSARGCDGEVRFVDVEGVHHRQMLLFAPCRDADDAVGIRQAVCKTSVAVRIWNKVAVHVDFVAKFCRWCCVPLVWHRCEDGETSQNDGLEL